MIKGFFKLIFGLIRLSFFLLLFLAIFHGWVIKQVFTLTLSHQLGTDVSVQSVKMDWKNTGFEVQGLEIGNPYDFPRGMLADIPLVIVSVDLPSIPQGVLRFKAVGVNLREFQVVNVARKGLNILALKPLQKSNEERVPAEEENRQMRAGGHRLRVVIDEFILSIGEISYLDTSGPSIKKNSYQAGIRGATYYDIRGAQDVIAIVVGEALKKMGMGYLESQFQKFQSRYLPAAAPPKGFFGKFMASVNGENNPE